MTATHHLTFFGVLDAMDVTADARLQHDSECLEDIIRQLLVSNEESVTIRQLFRVGAKPPTDRPRPLKVIFDSSATTQLLLSRGYRLRGRDVSMKRDLSVEDRERMRSALEELKNRTANGEKDLIVVNFRVVRRRKLLPAPLVVRNSTALEVDHSPL